MKHSVIVRDGTLTISVADERAWYDHIGFRFHSPELTVYLPKTEYTLIFIKAAAGDIGIPDGIKADCVRISVSTGDIRIRSLAANMLDLSSSTGEMNVSDVTCTGEMKVSTTTGDVNVMNVTCQTLSTTGSTGDLLLKNVIAAGTVSAERSTGDIVFDRSDAAEFFVKTSTGDVTGSFLTEKVFSVRTSTGRISVPQTHSGGKCEIVTSTGDIIIR